MSFRTKALGIGTGAAMIAALPFVAGWEGLRQYAYFDPVGIPTICYGETRDVEIGDFKTLDECDAMLAKSLEGYMAYVDDLVIVPLPDTRRVALTSFTYNVGVDAFARSTLLKKLNAGDTRGACDEMRRWVYAKGRKLRGLVNRREAERELCMRGLEDEV